MHPLLLFFLGDTVKDVLAGLLFFRRRQNQQADQAMRRWERHCKIPIVNWFLKRQAGKPTGTVERTRNKYLVKGIRSFTQTETFEHLVAAALNSRSKLKLRMPKKAAGGSHWGHVDIIS
jgi:hypothetical protein